jgi:hypothetical protein
MRDVGLYTIYDRLVASYEALPFTKPPVVDLESYVAGETLSALFDQLAGEEARIRSDPTARTTALLRRVFEEPRTPAEGGSRGSESSEILALGGWSGCGDSAAARSSDPVLILAETPPQARRPRYVECPRAA